MIRKEKKIAVLKRKINKGKPHTMVGSGFDSIVPFDMRDLRVFEEKFIDSERETNLHKGDLTVSAAFRTI